MPTSDAPLDKAMRDAPRFSPGFEVQLVPRGDRWLLLSTTSSADLDQGQVLTAGAAAQSALLALEAAGSRGDVEAFAEDALAVLHVLGPGPSRRAEELLAPADPTEAGVHRLRPSDLVHLNLCAEAFGCELLWQDDAADRAALHRAERVPALSASRPLSTVVTRGDTPAHWFAAGRAVRLLALVAADLGYGTRPVPHALGRRATREQVRAAWGMDGWPQVQLALSTTEPDF